MKFDFSEREYLRNEVSEIRISERKTKRILIFPSESILKTQPQRYGKRAKLGALSGIK